MRQSSQSAGKTRASEELRTLLYYILFSFFSFLCGLDLAKNFNLFTGSEIVSCSEVLKLN